MNYIAVQQDLSIDLYDYIHSFQGDEFFDIKQFFMPPGIFDGVVSILLQELKKKPIRPHLCEPNARKALIHQFVSQIRAYLKKTNHSVKDFVEICEVMPIIRLKLRKADLGALSDLQHSDVIDYKLYMQGYQKFCKHHWRPEDVRRVSLDGFKGNNTGLILWGEGGCGKS